MTISIGSKAMGTITCYWIGLTFLLLWEELAILSSTLSFVAVDLRVLEGQFGSSGVLLQSTPVTTCLEGGHLGSLGVLVQSTLGDDVF